MQNKLLSLYIQSAEELGIDSLIIEENRLVQFSKNGKHWLIYMAFVPINTSVASRISGNKLLAYSLLDHGGLSNYIPKHSICNDTKSITSFSKELGGSIVIKPSKGIGGKGVTIKPETNKELLQAFKYAKKYHTEVLVEEFVEGNNYRVLVLGGEVIACAERLPAFIVGDGKSTLSELIKEENYNRAKENQLQQINIDPEFYRMIGSQSITTDSVIEEDKRIFVRGNSNLSTGGVTIDKTDEIHSDYIDLATKATKTLGLELAGVDIITQDITKPIDKQITIINELNSNPGFRMHYYPYQGKPRKVAVNIMQYIYKNTN